MPTLPPNTSVGKLSHLLSLGNSTKMTLPRPWNSNAGYQPGNFVSTANGMWVCHEATSAGEHPHDSDRWWLVVGPLSTYASGSGAGGVSQVDLIASGIVGELEALTVLRSNGETIDVPVGDFSVGTTILVTSASPASILEADGEGAFDTLVVDDGMWAAGGTDGVSGARGATVNVVGPDVLAVADEFRPVVGVTANIGLTIEEGSYSGPLSGNESASLTRALWLLDAGIASSVSPVRKVDAIGYTTTLMVEEDEVPAVASYAGKWHHDVAPASGFSDGATVFVPGEAKVYVVTAGAFDAGTPVGPGLFTVASGPGQGLVYLQRSADAYDGEWVNDTNEQQTGLAMAQRDQPHYNWLNEALTIGDQSFSIPDTSIDLRYSLVQVWVDSGGGARRVLGSAEFRVTGANDLTIFDAEPDTQYRVVAWGWWND